jgi:hypothetical protein
MAGGSHSFQWWLRGLPAERELGFDNEVRLTTIQHGHSALARHDASFRLEVNTVLLFLLLAWRLQPQALW